MRSIIFLCFIAIGPTGLFAFDLKYEEIVSKHLNAIGSKDTRDSVKTLMAVGLSKFESKTPKINGGGKAVVVSDPNNLFFVLSLNSREYPFEKIGYFRGEPNLPFISAGTRSLLGAFLSEHDKVLSGGLFGGVMSLRWAMLNLDKMKPTIKTGGTKNVNGRKVYVLNYFPSGSGSKEFSIRLYFDSETFYHVGSEYRREVTAATPRFGAANQIVDSTLVLTETFSDFRPADAMMLPHRYQVEFQSNSTTSLYQSLWGISVGQYVINQKLTPDFFTFDSQ